MELANSCDPEEAGNALGEIGIYLEYSVKVINAPADDLSKHQAQYRRPPILISSTLLSDPACLQTQQDVVAKLLTGAAARDHLGTVCWVLSKAHPLVAARPLAQQLIDNRTSDSRWLVFQIIIGLQNCIFFSIDADTFVKVDRIWQEYPVEQEVQRWVDSDGVPDIASAARDFVDMLRRHREEH